MGMWDFCLYIYLLCEKGKNQNKLDFSSVYNPKLLKAFFYGASAAKDLVCPHQAITQTTSLTCYEGGPLSHFNTAMMTWHMEG